MTWRASASVILLNTQIRHVLMMRRGPTAKFMPNCYVFPGGLIDRNDIEFSKEISNFHLVDSQPIKMEGFEDDFALRVTALRELFEEAGILLTFDAQTRSSQVVTEADDPSLKEWRKKVVADSKNFSELFTRTCLADLNVLVPWSNWLTPFGYPKRFNTVFFVVPTTREINVNISCCIEEMNAAKWTTCSKFIEESAGKCTISLPPPQFYELARLKLVQHDCLIECTNPMQIVPQLVDIVDNDTLRCVLLPGDHLYNENERGEAMSVHKSMLKDILPDKEVDNFCPIHRLIFKLKPLIYTGHELHVFNINKMPYKTHLFYYSSNDYFPLS